MKKNVNSGRKTGFSAHPDKAVKGSREHGPGTADDAARLRIGDIMSPESWEEMMKVTIDEVTQKTEEGNDSKDGRRLRFYRASLVLDRSFFADEVDKWWMLYILWKEATRCQYEVAGFTLLDDRLQLVLCREEDRNKKADGEQAGQEKQDFLIKTLGEAYLDYYSGRSRIPVDSVRETTTWEELESPDSVVNECCRIHYLPVKEGYVENIRDFWWSSYQKYHGKYDWTFLNITPVLGCLSRKMSMALRTFEHRQKCWEKVKEDHEGSV